jgi:hypothetical protein
MAKVPLNLTDEEFYEAVVRTLDDHRYWGKEISLNETDRGRLRQRAFTGRYVQQAKVDVLLRGSERVFVWVTKRAKPGQVLLLPEGDSDRAKAKITLYGEPPKSRAKKPPPASRYDRDEPV